MKQRGRTNTSVVPTIWGYLQEHTPIEVESVKQTIRRPPFIFSRDGAGDWILLPNWRELDDEAAALFDVLQAGPEAGKGEIRRYRLVTFHPSFSYEDFVRGIRPVATGADGSAQFQMVDGVFKQICDEARNNSGKRYALFIDEINRANIAKVFGELISLIEPDKRGVFDPDGRMISGLAVQLPGGDTSDAAEPPFTVPANLDIYGTMNTADRSIALLDIALRRRFEFQEMEPQYGILTNAGGVKLGALLTRINDRLEYMLDRDHRIGHAYLMQVTSLEQLRDAFRLRIIPLLQEYFFDDFSRVAMVLSTSGPPLVRAESLTQRMLFAGSANPIYEDRTRWALTPSEDWAESSFIGMYSTVSETKTTQEVLTIDQ